MRCSLLATLVIYMADTIVFAGASLPSVPNQTWEELLEKVQVWPPAQQGDVFAAIDKKPKTIVLLDGYYFDGCDYTIPALKHEELIYALDTGIHIIGAASMGALYAADLLQYGMHGIGQVFEWFRDGVVKGKDEVVVLHLPQEFGYKLITVALVEVRYALKHLVRDGYLSLADSESLIQVIKELPFTERCLELILQLTHSQLGEETRDALHRLLISSSIKQSDAMLALHSASNQDGDW